MRPYAFLAALFVISSLAVANPTAAAPDQTQGVAFMAANVAANGELLGGAGVASSTRTGTGVYVVTFVRPFNGRDCAAVVTAHGSFIATLGGNMLDDTTVTVKTHTFQGTPFDNPFRLLAFCPR